MRRSFENISPFSIWNRKNYFVYMIQLKKLIMLVGAIGICALAHAQDPTIEELAKARTMKTTQIDSMMKEKGYEKSAMDGGISAYTLMKEEDGKPVMRAVHVGKPPHERFLDVEYGVWQKPDADAFIKQLVTKGYAKKVKM